MLDPHDHRRLGARLDLFHMEEDAPGMVYWHPRGFSVYRSLEEAVRREMCRQGLHEVRSPQLLRRPVWEASGHWSHFAEHMYVLGEGDREGALKPVSCPAHLQIARQRSLSWRDLPYRLGELGLVHRDERSGSLHGLFRLKQFCQDDGHILCAPDQVSAEVARFLARVEPFYGAFGLKPVSVALSTRPPDRMGSDAEWDRAEAWLRQAAEQAGLAVVHQPGEGAFYGPKLELKLEDRLGRAWQCGTIQLDMAMPARFGVWVDGSDGERFRPCLLHRALLGSLERFLGILLEQCGGYLPDWLAPEQAVVLPIVDAQRGYAAEVADRLAQAGVRVRVDASAERLSRRIKEAHQAAVPLVLVVGERERVARRVALRERSGQQVLDLDPAVQHIAERCAPPL
jgi:threonyl-tRNA synthetase